MPYSKIPYSLKEIAIIFPALLVASLLLYTIPMWVSLQLSIDPTKPILPPGDPNYSQIYNNALLFGAPYLMAGIAIGWLFVRWSTSCSWVRSIWSSVATHTIATFFAFYLLPLSVYLTTKQEHAWFAVGAISVFSCVPATTVEWILQKIVNRQELSLLFFGKLWLWKFFTLCICAFIALALVSSQASND